MTAPANITPLPASNPAEKADRYGAMVKLAEEHVPDGLELSNLEAMAKADILGEKREGALLKWSFLHAKAKAHRELAEREYKLLERVDEGIMTHAIYAPGVGRDAAWQLVMDRGPSPAEMERAFLVFQRSLEREQACANVIELLKRPRPQVRPQQQRPQTNGGQRR